MDTVAEMKEGGGPGMLRMCVAQGRVYREGGVECTVEILGWEGRRQGAEGVAGAKP